MAASEAPSAEQLYEKVLLATADLYSVQIDTASVGTDETIQDRQVFLGEYQYQLTSHPLNLPADVPNPRSFSGSGMRLSEDSKALVFETLWRGSNAYQFLDGRWVKPSGGTWIGSEIEGDPVRDPRIERATNMLSTAFYQAGNPIEYVGTEEVDGERVVRLRFVFELDFRMTYDLLVGDDYLPRSAETRIETAKPQSIETRVTTFSHFNTAEIPGVLPE